MLGARATGYSVNRYGIFGGGDAGDESDRLDVEWALADIAKPPADDAVVETLAIPADIEALRESDPAAAHEWRLRLRAQMEGLLAAGCASPATTPRGATSSPREHALHRVTLVARVLSALRA